MTGTLVNVTAVVAGSTIGLLIGSRFTDRFQRTTMQALALAIGILGLQMALQTKDILILLGSMGLGAITGEWLRVEDRLLELGDFFRKKLKSKDDNFAQGFVAATILFCVGSLTILGCVEEGVRGNAELLYAKSIIDGLSAIAFTAAMGVGVMLSALSIFVIQGSITLLASFAGELFNDIVIHQITSVGGLLIIGISINVSGIGKVPVGNFMPALVYGIVLGLIFV